MILDSEIRFVTAYRSYVILEGGNSANADFPVRSEDVLRARLAFVAVGGHCPPTREDIQRVIKVEREVEDATKRIGR